MENAWCFSPPFVATTTTTTSVFQFLDRTWISSKVGGKRLGYRVVSLEADSQVLAYLIQLLLKSRSRIRIGYKGFIFTFDNNPGAGRSVVFSSFFSYRTERARCRVFSDMDIAFVSLALVYISLEVCLPFVSRSRSGVRGGAHADTRSRGCTMERLIGSDATHPATQRALFLLLSPTKGYVLCVCVCAGDARSWSGNIWKSTTSSRRRRKTCETGVLLAMGPWNTHFFPSLENV